MKGAIYFLLCGSLCCLLSLELSGATSTGSSSTDSSNDSGTNDIPSVALTRQAIELGMEPAALGELWRTKQPVIISKPNAQGQLETTTYTLSPDGQNINKTSRQDQVPTTTPPTLPTPKASSENPQTDWEYLPSSVGNRRTFTLGGQLPFDNNWPSLRGWPRFDFPTGVTPQTTSKTEKDDQGRTVTTTIKTYQGPVGSNNWSTDLKPNWPSFDLPTGIEPQTSTKTVQDAQGNTITTRTRIYSTPILRTWSTIGGDVGGDLPASWQPNTPTIFDQGLPPWFKNPHFLNAGGAGIGAGVASGTGLTPATGELPSLVPTTTVNPLAVPTPYPFPTRQPDNGNYPPLPTAPPKPFEEPLKPVSNINLDELPAIKTTYRSSFNSIEPLKVAELDPHVRQMLNRGGITDDDIQKAKDLGSDVVRTRVLPDGRTIKTTVRVNNWSAAASPAPPAPLAPSAPFAPFAPLAPSPPRDNTSTAASPAPPAPPAPSALPAPPPPRDNTIENYLSQVHLSPTDIHNQNGELVKTIVDQNGRVLSVKFVLSDVKGEAGQRTAQEQPTK